jgi:hypothetical protein
VSGAKIIMMLSAGIALAGCVASDDTSLTLYEQLQAEDPALRIQAAKKAAQREDRQAVGLLIDRLTDPEADVRLFSHLALQKITGQDFGWRPWEPGDDRYEAARRWRAWWLEQQGASPEAARPQSAAAEWMAEPEDEASRSKESATP